ncbi:hypothetical protein [Thermostaphylospora chromogena]|uniref:Uncharacterized protein n=1 Tax=Thermostaphylospora chromogena TaxID=35622 RepID=A0A1H1CW29_9ACTN|nr:hypothetical protein [Thermostaphylospora chromogena]SDQ68465.1 hypothetical protein SAMN04489764_1682 [Thermostaphylospora chromogena]
MGNPITSAARQATVTAAELARLDELAMAASVHVMRLKVAVDEIAARLTLPDAPHFPTGVICLDAARARRAERNMVRRTLGGGA